MRPYNCGHGIAFHLVVSGHSSRVSSMAPVESGLSYVCQREELPDCLAQRFRRNVLQKQQMLSFRKFSWNIKSVVTRILVAPEN